MGRQASTIEDDRTALKTDRSFYGITDERKSFKGTACSRVAVIDESALFGEVLVSGLASIDGSFDYVLYPSIPEFLAYAGENPRLVILRPGKDINSLKSDVSALRDQIPEAPVVIICNEDDPSAVLAALEFGAAGYIDTTMTARAAVHVIHLVHAGGKFVPAQTLKRLASTPGPVAKKADQPASVLSPQEMRIARKLRKGTPNKIIAYDMNMAESTVKVHVRNIMKKLKASNRTQVAYLTQSMILGSEDQ